MRLILIFTIFAISHFCSIAQVNGNKKIETRTFPLANITSIDIGLNAETIIDCTAKEENISITMDNNLFDLIKKSSINNQLILDQKEWLAPSQKVKIIIGAPNLEKITQSTHETTIINNINSKIFKVDCKVGDIILNGKTGFLTIKTSLAEIDASQLVATNAKIQIDEWGVVSVHVINELNSRVSEDGELTYINQPKLLKGDAAAKKVADSKIVDGKTRYIKFTIKNNSSNRNHFYVVGPKPDGKKFSYGFPMMPLQKRKETWTIGTKIYKKSRLGMRKLLKTITAADENQVVKLF